jgi:hypothetical protein
MAFRAKPLRVPLISQRERTARLFIGAMASTFALHSFACSVDVHDERSSSTSSTTSSTTASSSSGGETGGFGGSGGMGGNGAGGGSADGGSEAVDYVAYSLFTHVPRFVIYKIDHTRNLCFRIWVEGFSGPGPLTIDVTSPWVTSRVEVTNNVADCTLSMGFPPQPATFANATTGTGTLMIPGGFPCAVDLHATISFDPVGPWVPSNEAFDVDALNVDGGCG